MVTRKGINFRIEKLCKIKYFEKLTPIAKKFS